ncbi:G-patch domain protein [Penicillium lividum]|nr:G-patch domain protein [Penicillium lividum]
MTDNIRSPLCPKDQSRNHQPEYPDNQDTMGKHTFNREKGQRRSRSPTRRGRNSYRDRDREGYQSPGYSGNRSFSRSRSRHGQPQYGQESLDVMMEGFPADMTEEDVATELRQAYRIPQLSDIRIIRDRETKASRQLGFLRFHNIEDARDFLERNFPHIYLYGPTAEKSTKVRIAYSHGKEERVRSSEGDWTCRMCMAVTYAKRFRCYRCNAPRPEIPPTGAPGVPPTRSVNTGDNDAASDNQPSQFLLFRGLEASVTEEIFAKGVAKLYRPGSGNDGSSGNQKKGAKVISTTGDANLGAREGTIRRVLLTRDRKSNESWRYGFAEFATVMDAQAAITRLHSFNKFTISSRPVMVSYIHAGVFVPVLHPTASTQRFTFSPLNNSALKLMYWDDNAYVTEFQVSAEEAAPSQIKTEKSTGNQEGSKATKETEKAKKRKAEPVDMEKAKKLAMPSQLQFWSNRHAELHGIPQEGDGALPDEGPQHGGIPESEGPPTQSYADPNRNCCYLCMTMFKSAAEVNRHERLSELHRKNLQDEACKTRAMAKLAKHGIPHQASAEYRDRARERRKTYGLAKTGFSLKAAAPKEEEEAPVQSNSKGASLLSKMGWSEGSGLGAQGTGVTAPIATEVYAQGVGLGAQNSKLGDAVEEAGRNTRGRYDEFLEKTRETARQRYDQMNK